MKFSFPFRLFRSEEQLSLLPPQQTLPPAGQRFVSIDDHIVPYHVSRRSRRAIRLKVDQQQLWVSAPSWVSLTKIEDLIHEKADWVLKNLAQQEPTKLGEGYNNFEANAAIYFKGISYTLLTSELTSRVCDFSQSLYIKVGRKSFMEHTKQFLKEEALSYFKMRVSYFCALAGTPAKRVALTQAQGRWGSCSSERTVRLHWRLIHLPPELIDYVIAHEVAHLSHMDHSPHFWQKLSTLQPDYAQQRLKLKDYGVLLKIL
jgi:predicted metal-dependent hydrolase